MKFTQEQYEENLNYVKGMFSLGGLSECGKTTAGKRFAELGIKKGKIIHVEKEMMLDRGYDLSDGMKNEHFVQLYSDNQEEVFKEFLFRFIEHMKEEGFEFASIESLYRAPLGAFLKQELGEKMANIYIDAPVLVRAEREMVKINAKEEEGIPKITIEEMIKKVQQKDQFKVEHKAEAVKDIADYVVNNDDTVSLDQFIGEIDRIAYAMGVEVSK